ncbi:MAG: M16 family metallopeptidase [Armatimonadota bacterium]
MRTALHLRTSRLAARLLALAAAILLGAATCRAAPILDPAKITERTYDNGFRLVVKTGSGWGLASANLVIRAGSAYEAEGQVGAAHLLEHLLFEATDLREEQRVGPAIEALGGHINAMTSRDFTQIEVTVASQYLDSVLEMLAQAVFEPRLTPVAVAREREVVIRELTDRLDSVGGALDDLLWATAYGTHPYGRPVGGNPEQVSELSEEDLVAFYTRFYVPANMALVVVGDVDRAELEQRVGELFGARPAAPLNLPEIPAEPAPTEVSIAAETRESEATIVSFGWLAPGVEDFDAVCAMDLIYTVLGEGALGRLHKALNEQGLALMTDVQYLTQRDPGLLIVTALTAPDKEPEARTAIIAEIERLRNEQLTPEQLDQAKRVLRIGYAFSNEAFSDQAGSLAFYEGLGDYRLAIDYIDRVNAVTPELLQQVARRYLDPNAYTLAIVRPAPRPGTTEEARATCAEAFVQG